MPADPLSPALAAALRAHPAAPAAFAFTALGRRDELALSDRSALGEGAAGAADSHGQVGRSDAPATGGSPGGPAGGADGAEGAEEDWAGISDGLSVHVYGHHALVGPFTPSGEPGCGRCLVRRWQAVRTRGLREALELGSGTRAAGPTPWAVPFAADQLAAVIAAHTVAVPTAERFPYAYLVDLETLRVTRFAVVPDAECPRCGPVVPDSAADAGLALGSSPKRAPDDFRARPADAYDVPLEAFVNPVAGMLGPSVVPDLVSTSTSSTVGSFFLRSGDYLRECFWGGHTPRYRSSVRVGLLEGLERFAGMRARGKRTDVVAAYDDLGPDAALDPRRCGLYSEEFHRAEPGVRPFDPARPIPWVWGHSLRDHRPLLVPEILAYYHAPGGLANRFVQESSNGCASGGSPAEAVYFGLMEVIERDAFLLAWFGRAPLTEIDGSASRSPQTRAMIDRLAMYGYRARFFDTRVTFPVPVVTAVAERVDGGLGRLCFGAGASLDPEAALAAGLCEIATDAVNLRSRTAARGAPTARDGRRLQPGAGAARPPAALRPARDGRLRRLPAARRRTAARQAAVDHPGRTGPRHRRARRRHAPGRRAVRGGRRQGRVRRHRGRPDDARAAPARLPHRRGDRARPAADRLRLGPAARPAPAPDAHRPARRRPERRRSDPGRSQPRTAPVPLTPYRRPPDRP